jgi:hypothetical protein
MESFLKHHLDDDHCFLCGLSLTDETRSDEHVFPRWLQQRHDLWNLRVALLNGTTIPYRQLRIPCCRACNNGPLSELESEVKELLGGSYRVPTEAQEHRLFQWCSKLLYGLLHRELTLIADRRDESQGTIVQRKFLEGLLTFHHFMTSIRRPFRFEGFKPYSLFVSEALASPEQRESFDYMDFVVLGGEGDLRVPLVLSLRTGHFAIFCVFQDNGLQKARFQDEVFDRLRGTPLHPIQFLELACKSAYKHSRLSFAPKYHSLALDDPSSAVVVTPLTFPNGDPWEPWIDLDYAHLFCAHAARKGFKGVPDPQNFYVGDKHHTWLFDADGNPQRMPPA